MNGASVKRFIYTLDLKTNLNRIKRMSNEDPGGTSHAASEEVHH